MTDHSRTFMIHAFRDDWVEREDDVVVEEPLEIRLGFQRRGQPRQQSVSITMRTPGHDFELALGFLYTERILTDMQAVQDVVYCGEGRNQNVVRVELHDDVEIDLGRLQRHFYTTSSCGVCGKTSLEALSVTGYAPVESDVVVDGRKLASLPDRLLKSQTVFGSTGGLHAAGLFDLDGHLVKSFEDVGRHNAVDKLIGWAWRNQTLPLDQHVLVLSGRASFELMQKALAAGIPVVAAVGAPSSLAVEIARRFDITLAGFVREGRLNLYSAPRRVAT